MESRLTGKHVLIILLSVFGVVFAVNGFMAYSALRTISGVQRGATYEAGLRYNATLAEQRAQEALHWAHTSEASAWLAGCRYCRGRERRSGRRP